MKLYIATSIFSFSGGLFLSLFSYIPIRWVLFIIITVAFLAKVAFEASNFSGSQLKMGLAFILPYLMKLTKKKTGTGNGTEIKIEKNRIIIEFDHKGKTRRHILPYNRKELSKHNINIVHLVDEDGQEIELSHIPGATFTHTAEELGGKRFKVTNKLTQEVVVYENEPPRL